MRPNECIFAFADGKYVIHALTIEVSDRKSTLEVRTAEKAFSLGV